MRIITFNLNGIRSAERKGFFSWLKNQNADIICLQELKAQEAIINAQTHLFMLENYYSAFHFAEKKGYSGVGIYSRYQPKKIITGLGWQTADQEGRYVAIDLGKLIVASLYMPSGTSGEHRQAIKFDFLDRFKVHLEQIKQTQMPHIICGDWNIAHKQIDLKNWRSNQKNSGFLPEERAWLDHVFENMAYVDAFRVVNKDPDQYTWWSHRGRAREKNVGWRIDYQVATPTLRAAIQSASIYKEQLFSDHAPLTLDYDNII